MMHAELAGRFLMLNDNFDHIFVQAMKNSFNIIFGSYFLEIKRHISWQCFRIEIQEHLGEVVQDGH